MDEQISNSPDSSAAPLVPEVVSKACRRCKVTKPIEEFGRHHRTKDGRFHECMVCWQGSMHRNQAHERDKRGKSVLDEPDEVQQIAMRFLANPDTKPLDVSIELNIPVSRIQYWMRNNEYLKAMKILAKRKVNGLVPLAVRGIEDSLNSKNEEIKYKSSMEVLKNEDVFGPSKVDIQINQMTDLTIEQLNAIVERAKVEPIKQTIIEAEVLP